MKKRDIIPQIELEGKQQRKLATKTIAFELMKIMKKHIGNDAEISQKNLFKKLFKTEMTDNLTDWFKWEFTKKAMNYCRKNTYCFIVSRNNGKEWYYFVVENNEDAEYYCDLLNKNINSMKTMMNKVKRAAKDKWHTIDWITAGNPALTKLNNGKIKNYQNKYRNFKRFIKY